MRAERYQGQKPMAILSQDTECQYKTENRAELCSEHYPCSTQGLNGSLALFWEYFDKGIIPYHHIYL